LGNFVSFIPKNYSPEEKNIEDEDQIQGHNKTLYYSYFRAAILKKN
jgi:hypothetical protein